MNDLWNFYSVNYQRLLNQVVEHLGLTVSSVLLACLLSMPLGVWIAKKQKVSSTVLNITGILQTIPSIALLGFMIPILGIGVKPAIFALFLYSLLPIVRNVYTGITGIEKSIIESARGMGMSFWQILFKVEIPLALPTIFAGIRTATVINVGIATLAAYIAAGGLGEFIFGGIALNNSTMILAGALPAALLAIILDFLLGKLQKSGTRKMKRNLSVLSVSIVLLLGITAFTGGKETVLKAGYPPEFLGRKDGLPALHETYNLRLSHVVLAPALMYNAIHQKRVDVISGYSTDGRIKAYNLRILEDDKNAFPPYQAGLLIRKGVLEENPELESIINKLNGRINDSVMTQLNFLVDHEKRSVASVSKEFLEVLNLYQEPQKPKRTLIIGSKIFTEQYILTEIYKQLLEGHAPFSVETKKGLGGTKICFDALTEGEIDMYPEYSGTALQVLLNRQNKPDLNSQEIYHLVQNELKEKFSLKLSDPLGFNNTYALMMRNDQAENLNINTISGLKEFIRTSD